MSFQRIIFHHSGHWERTTYVGGDIFLMHFPKLGLTRNKVLREIREQLGAEFEYVLYYLTNISDSEKIKVVLKNDTDLFRLIVEQDEAPTVYVINKNKNINICTPSTQHSTVFPDVGDPRSISLESLDDEGRNVEELEERAGDARDAEQRLDLFESLITEFGGWIREPGHIDRIIGHRSIHSDQQHTRDGDSRANEESIRNWLIPYVDLDTALPLGHIEHGSGPSIGELRVGGLFKEKDDLSIAVGLHHMEIRKEYVVERSATDRVGFVCKKERCEFLCRARQKGSIWIIIKFDPDHTCSVDLEGNSRRQVPAKVLGAFFARRLITEGAVLKPNEMVSELQSQYGIQIDYSFAMRARNIAIEMYCIYLHNIIYTYIYNSIGLV